MTTPTPPADLHPAWIDAAADDIVDEHGLDGRFYAIHDAIARHAPAPDVNGLRQALADVQVERLQLSAELRKARAVIAAQAVYLDAARGALSNVLVCLPNEPVANEDGEFSMVFLSASAPVWEAARHARAALEGVSAADGESTP